MGQPRAISLSFAAQADEVPRMRHFVARWLRSSNVPDPKRSDLVLATAEAINNGCQHACPPGRSLHISCIRRDRRVSVSVSDDGHGFTPDPHVTSHEPPLDETDGRGLFLMRCLVDQVTIKATTRGTTVTLESEVPSALSA